MPGPRKRIATPDIRFTDEKLARLMNYVKSIERELHRVQAMLDLGATGQVLTKQSARTFDATWDDPTGGGGGSDADGENLGAGEGEVFKATLAGVLQFRTLTQGTNITITQDGEEVTINATSSISVAWDDISGKPATFPPSAHTHPATAVTYNNGTSGLTATNVQAAIDEIVAGGGGGYTDEDAQDAVGNILIDTTTIDFDYDDLTGTITADVIEGALSIDWSQLTSPPTMIDDIAGLVDPGADRILFWDDSAGAIDWLTVGTNLSITGTTLSASGGSANVTPDTHPASPNAFDDEFEAGSLDAKWTLLNAPTTTTLANGSLLLSDASNSGNNVGGIEQTLSGVFKIRAKIARVHGAIDNRGGIYCGVAGGKIYLFGIYYDTGAAGVNFYVNRQDDATGTGVANVTISGNNAAGAAAMAQGLWWYLEIEYDGTDVFFRFSYTGIDGSFADFVSVAAASFLGGAPTRGGLFSDRASASTRSLISDWIRRLV